MIDGPLLDAARAGDRRAQERALERFAPWLRLLARAEIQTRLGRRVDASDIAQQAMLEAVKAFPRFQGGTEAELVAWLRSILAHVLSHEVRRHFATAKRDAAREISLEASLADTSRRLGDVLPADTMSPSAVAVWREESVRLAEALERLPEEYREVICLRHVDGLGHEEIAERLGRTAGAVRMLWVRALARLKREIGANG